MRIKKIEPFILHVPLPGTGISDSTNSITHWGFAGVILHGEDGLKGYGFTGTHAFVAGDRLIIAYIADVYGPLLQNEVLEDRSCIERLWKKLHSMPPIQWIGRAGISHLALAAIDIALWDLLCKQQQIPLWKLLNETDSKPVLDAYNTNAGWLNIPIERLVDGCLESKDSGFKGVKIKVGNPSPEEDLKRISAVRDAIGMDYALMIDGNGRWDLPTALQYIGRLDEFNLDWFEEPLYFDDLIGHVQLARSMKTPVALGEQLYSQWHFNAFMETGAVHIVQVDALRVAGITEWLRVADKALKLGLPVVSHVGDMMQVHQQLSMAHPAANLLEYIPWTRHCFEEPATVVNGLFNIPQMPGAGTTITKNALQQFGVTIK